MNDNMVIYTTVGVIFFIMVSIIGLNANSIFYTTEMRTMTKTVTIGDVLYQPEVYSKSDQYIFSGITNSTLILTKSIWVSGVSKENYQLYYPLSKGSTILINDTPFYIVGYSTTTLTATWNQTVKI